MNFAHYIADGIFVIIAAALMINYAKKGFIKSVIRSARVVLSILAVYLWGNALGKVICGKWIGAPVRNAVYEKINGIYQGAVDAFQVEKVKEALPSFLLNEKTSANLDSLEGAGADLVEQITDTVATPIASLISKILGWVLVFVLAMAVLSVGAWLLEKVISHIKLLDRVNTLLGLVWGLLAAAVVLLVLSSLVRVFLADSPIYTKSIVVKFFGESGLLKSLRFLDLGKTLVSNIFH